jgi:predicted esterase YcpF (UPF0227 family)
MLCFNKLTALYLHGYSASYDVNSEKVQSVKKVFGRTRGIDINYTAGFELCQAQCMAAIQHVKPDILVGSSMGGHMVTHLSAVTKIPFIAFNPAIEPSVTLRQFVGQTVEFRGKPYVLDKEIVDNYPDANYYGVGIMFVEHGDQVIDAKHTHNVFNAVYPIVSFPGGEHRFTRSLEAAKIGKDYFF